MKKDDETITDKSTRKIAAAAPVPLEKGDMYTLFKDKNGKAVSSRIYSVPGFEVSFPDQNDVQLLAAQK